MSANSPFPFRFHLRGDYHLEVGWRDFVREQATSNPALIREILNHRVKLDLGPDPLSFFERWEPYTMGFMFYFWMIRKGQTAPTFVATDGLMTMFIEPLPANAHLAGLPSDLLELAHDAIGNAGGSINPSPLVPMAPENRPARADVFPEQMVVHRYSEEAAYLRPCLATLRAIEADPIAWSNQEPGREMLTP